MAWDGISWSALFGASYLIGSIPTAYLAARILSGQDIRDLGDHNAGAANVFRNVGHRAGMAVGAIDIAKGSLAVLLTKLALDSAAGGNGLGRPGGGRTQLGRSSCACGADAAQPPPWAS